MLGGRTASALRTLERRKVVCFWHFVDVACALRDVRWISVTASDITEVTRLAQRTVEVGKDDAIALAAAGWALAHIVRDLELN